MIYVRRAAQASPGSVSAGRYTKASSRSPRRSRVSRDPARDCGPRAAAVAVESIDRAVPPGRRTTFLHAYIAGVEGPRHVTRGDTIRLKVSYGTAGTRDGGRGTGKARLLVSVEGHDLAAQPIALPDSGVVTTEVTLPASRVPRP